MRKNSTFARIGGLVDIIGSAISVAAAVEGNRKAKAEHLRVLGIDPAQFEKIRR